MPQEIRNITEDVMSQIHRGQVKMRPKWYFVAGSLFAFIGLAASIIASVFLLSLIQFVLRSHGPMGSYRLDQMLAAFPWWAPVLAIVSLALGVVLLRRYDFSYRKNFLLIAVGFVFAVLVAGFIIDRTGLDDAWLNRGPMRGMMRQYVQPSSDPSVPGAGQGRMHRSIDQ
jgi:hypothetical protein